MEKDRGECGGHDCQRATGPCGCAPTADGDNSHTIVRRPPMKFSAQGRFIVGLSAMYDILFETYDIG